MKLKITLFTGLMALLILPATTGHSDPTKKEKDVLSTRIREVFIEPALGPLHKIMRDNTQLDKFGSVTKKYVDLDKVAETVAEEIQTSADIYLANPDLFLPENWVLGNQALLQLYDLASEDGLLTLKGLISDAFQTSETSPLGKTKSLIDPRDIIWVDDAISFELSNEVSLQLTTSKGRKIAGRITRWCRSGLSGI